MAWALCSGKDAPCWLACCLQLLAAKEKLLFMETSAADGSNIEPAFRREIEEVVNGGEGRQQSGGSACVALVCLGLLGSFASSAESSQCQPPSLPLLGPCQIYNIIKRSRLEVAEPATPELPSGIRIPIHVCGVAAGLTGLGLQLGSAGMLYTESHSCKAAGFTALPKACGPHPLPCPMHTGG